MKKLLSIAIALSALFAYPSLAQTPCSECSPQEHTSMQLHRFLDTVKILKLIHNESSEIDPKTLDFYLRRYGSEAEILALLASPTEAQHVDLKPKNKQERAQKISRSPVRKPKGLEGLLVAHAQAANPAIGFAASATIVSHGRPYPLGIGNRFKHNESSYVLESVNSVSNEDGSIGHSVAVRQITTGVVKNLPWNLGAKKQ